MAMCLPQRGQIRSVCQNPIGILGNFVINGKQEHESATMRVTTLFTRRPGEQKSAEIF